VSDIRERWRRSRSHSHISLTLNAVYGVLWGQGSRLAPTWLASARHAMMRVTMPAPTVLSPSRMAKRDFSSIATSPASARS
jgi:hypothetical protein